MRKRNKTTLQHMLAQDPLFNDWSAETQAVYVALSERLMREAPLVITIGKGGLSYYKGMGDESVFVCHFNAKPQRLRNDLGFADFRPEALRNKLDLRLALDAIQKAAEPEIRFKLNKQWCSLHFSLSDYARVADIFYEHIIARVQCVYQATGYHGSCKASNARACYGDRMKYGVVMRTDVDPRLISDPAYGMDFWDQILGYFLRGFYNFHGRV